MFTNEMIEEARIQIAELEAEGLALLQEAVEYAKHHRVIRASRVELEGVKCRAQARKLAKAFGLPCVFA